jgi:small subunit ribosomal protein S9
MAKAVSKTVAKKVKINHNYGTGRRKTAVARVYIRQGKGIITVNKKPFAQYFTQDTTRTLIQQPLVVTGLTDKFDIVATVYGGGYKGQAGAMRLGIARALVEYDVANNDNISVNDNTDIALTGVSATSSASLKKVLRAHDLMTRDPRKVERKKVGRHKARKSPQYSKR